MTGMDAATGRPLAGEDHIRQSIARILTTPIGSRIARREFGSLVPELIDQPMNAAGRMRLFAATALAILRWEPRVRLTDVALTTAVGGAFALQLDIARLDAAGRKARLVLPLRDRGGLTPAYPTYA